MKVYAFLYNSCIYESAHATMSLHKTRKGAEMAMEVHKAEKEKEKAIAKEKKMQKDAKRRAETGATT